MTRNKAQIAGLVLAAGYSNRMGNFKPLLPFGDATVIESAVGTFLKAGVHDVRVVVGWRANEIIPILADLGVIAVINPRFDSGMYSSVVAGVESMNPEVEAFLLLPGDYPLVKPETVQTLIDAYLHTQAGIIYPRFLERRGHPPLILTRYFEIVLPPDLPGGVRTLLRQHDTEALDVEVTDRGVVMDLDDIDDYRKALEYSRRPEAQIGNADG
ncbi:MAG: nucleotidyltransferase family protein [Dehalococcoidia bacterium]|nr:nucleotidyltransferase family protein [Dehalococcoidia bacterium]